MGKPDFGRGLTRRDFLRGVVAASAALLTPLGSGCGSSGQGAGSSDDPLDQPVATTDWTLHFQLGHVPTEATLKLHVGRFKYDLSPHTADTLQAHAEASSLVADHADAGLSHYVAGLPLPDDHVAQWEIYAHTDDGFAPMLVHGGMHLPQDQLREYPGGGLAVAKGDQADPSGDTDIGTAFDPTHVQLVAGGAVKVSNFYDAAIYAAFAHPKLRSAVSNTAWRIAFIIRNAETYTSLASVAWPDPSDAMQHAVEVMTGLANGTLTRSTPSEFEGKIDASRDWGWAYYAPILDDDGSVMHPEVPKTIQDHGTVLDPDAPDGGELTLDFSVAATHALPGSFVFAAEFMEALAPVLGAAIAAVETDPWFVGTHFEIADGTHAIGSGSGKADDPNGLDGFEVGYKDAWHDGYQLVPTSFDPDTAKFTCKARTKGYRHQAVCVGFRDQDGNLLEFEDMHLLGSAYDRDVDGRDPMGAISPPSPWFTFGTGLGPHQRILGVPTQDTPGFHSYAEESFDFRWPDEAHTASVYFCSLSFKGDSPDATATEQEALKYPRLAGTTLTVGMDLAVPAMLTYSAVDALGAAASYNRLKTLGKVLLKCTLPPLLESGLDLGLTLGSGQSAAEMVPKLAGIWGRFAKSGLPVNCGFKGGLKVLAASSKNMVLLFPTWLSATIAASTAKNAAVDAIPIADAINIALQVTAIAANVATLSETLDDMAVYPAFSRIDITRTGTLNVHLTTDEAEGFPKQVTRVHIAVHPSANTSITSRGNSAFTGPGLHHDISSDDAQWSTHAQLDYALSGFPLGGDVTVRVVMLTESGWIAAYGDVTARTLMAGTTDAVDLSVAMTINTVPITPDTQYEHFRTLGYKDDAYWWDPARPTAQPWGHGTNPDTSGERVAGLVSITVNQRVGQLGYSWTGSNPDAAVCGAADNDGLVARLENINQNVHVGEGQPGANRKVLGDSGLSCGVTVGQSALVVAYCPTDGWDGRHFFLDASEDPPVLRRMALGTGEPDLIDPSAAEGWGRFVTPVQLLAVHPGAFAMGIDLFGHTMQRLNLDGGAGDASRQAQVMATVRRGALQGQIDTVVACAAMVTGQSVLLLEQGNRRIQAITREGDAAPIFTESGDSEAWRIDLTRVEDTLSLDPEQVTYLDVACDPTDYVYVLSYYGDETDPSAYRLDVYSPSGQHITRTQGFAAAKLALDKFRTAYTLDYSFMTGADGNPEPTVSQWIPSPPDCGADSGAVPGCSCPFPSSEDCS